MTEDRKRFSIKLRPNRCKITKYSPSSIAFNSQFRFTRPVMFQQVTKQLPTISSITHYFSFHHHHSLIDALFVVNSGLFIRITSKYTNYYKFCIFPLSYLLFLTATVVACTIEKTSHTTNFVSDPLLRCYLYAHDRSTNEMRVSPLSLVLI